MQVFQGVSDQFRTLCMRIQKFSIIFASLSLSSHCWRKILNNGYDYKEIWNRVEKEVLTTDVAEVIKNVTGDYTTLKSKILTLTY